MATIGEIVKPWTSSPSLEWALNNWSSSPSYIANPERQLEVALFRAMMDHFDCNHSSQVAVVTSQETHKHLVLPDGKQPKCEISDVMFVVYSQYHRIVRMTHLQAKRISKEIQIRGLGTQNFIFNLDLRQYTLLHNRKSFTNAGKSHYPQDTFCNPNLSDSIASYGVFFIGDDGLFHMAYEVAPLVDLVGVQKGEFLLLQDVWNYSNHLWHKNYQSLVDWQHRYAIGDCAPNGELLSTLNTDCFEQELLSCHVGTRIERDNQPNGLLHFVCKTLKDSRYVIHEQGRVVEEFYELMRRLEVPFSTDFRGRRDEESAVNLILINADRR